MSLPILKVKLSLISRLLLYLFLTHYHSPFTAGKGDKTGKATANSRILAH